MDVMEELANTLKGELEEFGISIGKNPEQIMRKAARFCNTYCMDIEEFTECWLAFAASNSLSEITDKDLDVFEKQELSTRNINAAKSTKSKSKPAPIVKLEDALVDSKVVIYGLEDKEYGGASSDEMETDDLSDVLNVYGVTTTKKEKRKNKPAKPSLGSGMEKVFSPVTYSPFARDKSLSYASRTTAGDSVFRYKCKDSDYWSEVFDGDHPPVRVVPSQRTKEVLDSETTTPLRFMHQPTTSVASIINGFISDIGYEMLSQDDKDLQDLRMSSVEPSWYLGRIRGDGGKLSSGSVYLEGELEISGGHVVSLDLTNVEEYRLFPGQVAMIKGMNEVGKYIRVSEVYVPLPLPMPQISPNLTRPLNIIVACGPYTPSDSLQSEPLLDLVKIVKRDRPQVCVLMGPFIDPSHPMIASGVVAETFDDMFENTVSKIKTLLEDVPVHLVLIPSFKDAHHFQVYPTPQYSLSSNSTKISVFPDPAVFEVSGITFGVTSTDILKHLADTETAKSTISDRMGGLSRLVLSQRNFYPLYPSHESVPLDMSLWKRFCKFTHTPHVLILPSVLKHFIKEVESTIVVNPEKLTKGKAGGSYARLQIKLPDSVADKVESIADYCCGEIVKI